MSGCLSLIGVPNECFRRPSCSCTRGFSFRRGFMILFTLLWFPIRPAAVHREVFMDRVMGFLDSVPLSNPAAVRMDFFRDVLSVFGTPAGCF